MGKIVKLSPLYNDGQLDNDGLPLVGGQVFWYLAGTSTLYDTYTSNLGTVAQSNPVILNSRGESANPIWLEAGITYKAVLMDSLSNLIRTIDNISGINDNVTTTDSEWILYDATSTYQNATSFSVSDDKTAIFTINRRLKFVVSGGTGYATVTNSVYAAGITTVTIDNDSTILDAGLSSIYYGIIDPVHMSISASIFTEVGRISMQSGNTPPDNWLTVPTAQTNVNISAYPELYAYLVTNSGFLPQTFTITIASPGVVTKATHGFLGGEKIRLSTTGALPTGLNTSTDYYVLYVDANTFRLSLTDGGAAINTSGTQSGIHTYLQTLWGFGDGSTTFGIPWIAEGEVFRQAGVSIGTHNVGSIPAHSHTLNTFNVNATVQSGAGASNIWQGAVVVSTSSVGSGTTNLPAGSSIRYMVKYK